jgi:hypothetical protein
MNKIFTAIIHPNLPGGIAQSVAEKLTENTIIELRKGGKIGTEAEVSIMYHPIVQIPLAVKEVMDKAGDFEFVHLWLPNTLTLQQEYMFNSVLKLPNVSCTKYECAVTIEKK